MSTPESLGNFEWLLSSDAAPHLASVTKELDGGRLPTTAALIERLRKGLAPERVRLLVEQVALRNRATKKFARAAEMFLTSVLLEQSTSEAIAKYKAASFQSGNESDRSVIDLCCGIGGDALGFVSREFDVTVMDRNEVACRLASHNLNVYRPPNSADLSAASVNTIVGDVAQAPVADFAAWHIDPDRRPEGRRTTRIESHEPGMEVLQRLLDSNGNAAIKLAPATELPSEWASACEQEWIGEQRECKQQLLRFGGLARDIGRRSATVVGADGTVTGSISGEPDEPVEFVGKEADYLYEPHAAVRASQLVGALANEHNLCRMGLDTSYMTGAKIELNGTLARFRVLDSMPFDRKKVKQQIGALGLSRLEVKTRGAGLDPAAERKRLSSSKNAANGDKQGCVFLFSVEGKMRAVLTTRE